MDCRVGRKINVKIQNYAAKQSVSAKPMHLEQCIAADFKAKDVNEIPEWSARSQESRMMEMIQDLQKHMQDLKLQSIKLEDAQLQQNQQLRNQVGVQVRLQRWLDPKNYSIQALIMPIRALG